MSLQDIVIEVEYRTLSVDMANDFYIPLLREAILYKRAVGFFSSSALASIAPGLFEIYKNKGKIRLVASPNLSDDDIQAIENGYKQRDEIIADALYRELKDYDDFCKMERLNLLANLIAEGVMDIKIAVSVGKNGIGIYHEKVGIIEDLYGNKIAFSGSMNETGMAFEDNYEAVDVFCSWKGADAGRVVLKDEAFDKIWENLDDAVEVKSFPEVNKFLIEKYQRGSINDMRVFDGSAGYKVKQGFGFVQPYNIKLHDYQQDAIEVWKTNNYCGIFDMATGTGKTYTALGALSELCLHVKRLAVIIVCPYQHLVEQWGEDINAFGVKPIIGYSGSSYKDYKKALKNSVFNFRMKFKEFFCFITTNASYITGDIRKEIEKLGEDAILVVDEAHNFGAENLQKTLRQNFQYRLALSATFERHNDEAGTNMLFNFFGKKCIEYNLERAIKEKKLTPYYYHPVIVYLTEDELELYQAYTSEIAKNIIRKEGKVIITVRAKKFMLKRARLIAGAIGKIEALRCMAYDFKDDYNMLIYCGATNVQADLDESVSPEADMRQIDCISRMLNFDFGMRTAQFTSNEKMEERHSRIEDFQNHDIQALIAIKCLDEGVNIPSIQKAFILASTTNPKEYIQRRGRVLRLYPGKKFAEIYDFVTLPRELSVVSNTSAELAKAERSLVLKEMRRMYEFGRLAINFYDTDNLIVNLRDAYNIYEDLGEYDEEEIL